MILNLWDATKAVLREETRKISNKQPNLTPQATRERSTNKIQRQQKGKNDKSEQK